MTKMNLRDLNTVNGGYIFETGYGEYDIIDDDNGKVLFKYKTPSDFLNFFFTGGFEEMAVRAMAIAKGQSPEKIGWAKLNELRGFTKKKK